MEKLLASRLLGPVLLVMLGFSVWTSGIWRAPFVIEWHTFPSKFFWIEVLAAVLAIGMVAALTAMIVLAMRGRTRGPQPSIDDDEFPEP